MSNLSSRGVVFRQSLTLEKPLQVVGVLNAYAALLAKSAGFKAIYLSGGGVATSSLGVPDLGITTLDDVLIDVRRITDACDLPLLVDVDTGFGSAFNIARTVKSLIKSEAAAMHLEDQVQAKRCGHRPGKALVSKDEMCDRIKAAVDARTDPGFVIMARTDALASEGLEATIERAQAYILAGADMIFAEAVTELNQYQAFVDALHVPVLANMTEFGQTPLFTREQLASVGIGLALYPLSAFRAMSAAALRVFQTIRDQGTQESMLSHMQTRDELYQILNYYAYEEKLDELFKSSKSESDMVDFNELGSD
ncbi:MAG: methylisocitrate lyase [Chloroflexi bacterium HGW-Chloroflexi-2]|nr:MAG: methylisocitrate lyase [Chloroflexi bacterium HGW-Chloroflexi-2]